MSSPFAVGRILPVAEQPRLAIFLVCDNLAALLCGLTTR